MSEQYIELGGVNPAGYFTRNHIFNLKESGKAIESIKNAFHNRDIYYCTYIFDNLKRDENTNYISPLYFDLDGDITSESSFEKVRLAVKSLIVFLCTEFHVSVNDIQIFFSGSKGFHLLINPTVLGIVPDKHLNNLYKSIILYIAKTIENGDYIDTKIYDSKRLIRIPNTINGKTGLYKIPILYKTIQEARLEDILELARNPQPILLYKNNRNTEAARAFSKFREKIQKLNKPHQITGKSIIPSEIQKLPICVKHIIETPVSKGCRNNTMALLASVLIQNGYLRERALEVLYSWNSYNDPPSPQREVMTTYMSAEHMAQQGRGYGCSSIRELGLFGSSVCQNCEVNKIINQKKENINAR